MIRSREFANALRSIISCPESPKEWIVTNGREKKNDKNDEERRWKYRVIFFGGRQDYKINPAQPVYTYMFDFDTNWF